MVFSFCCCVQLHSRQDDSCLDEDDMLIDERNLELEMIVLVFLDTEKYLKQAEVQLC